MAAAPAVLLLWLLALLPPQRVPAQPHASAGRRFSEHKLCADHDCSMLMYRGEALEDFTGPDCRFVNFKKGDPVYVYYKLAGRPPEVWAGSIGRIFGYFPKDLIKVVHEYTKEELQVPTDETDFVCFDGGRDNFDNYNVEELLGFLELYNSATGDSGKAVEKTSLHVHVEKTPEVSKENEPEPEPEEASSEENKSVFLENTNDLKERFIAEKNHANSQMGDAKGEQFLFEPLEEMLQDQLKVPESENNKTSNSSQVLSEQEKIDAYKRLQKDMTLDLKTKFGSTADALVSDDETTRLVTSLEDNFAEELDAEYYTFEKEEENKENFDELPLLIFTSEEDMKTPVKSGVEKYSTDKEQNSNGEDKVEITLPPAIKKGDKTILTTWGDTIFSIVTGGEEKTGVMDLESPSSEEEKEDDDSFIPDSKPETPRSAIDYTGPENVEDGLLSVEVPERNNGKDPEVDTELHIRGKRREVQEPERGLVQSESELDGERQEEMAVHSSTPDSNLDSLLAAENGKDILKSASGDRENDQNGAAIHVSEGTLHGEKPGEQILEGGSESRSVHNAAGNQMNEGKIKRESLDIVPLLGDSPHNASRDSVAEVNVLVSEPEPHMPSMEHQHEEFKEEVFLKTQNQPRFSSPHKIGLLREQKAEAPSPGRNLSEQRGRAVATAGSKRVSEKTRPAAAEVSEDSSGTREADQTDSARGPGFHAENPEAEEDDYPPEELLEDENAVIAKQSREKSPGTQDRQADVNVQVTNRAIFRTMNPDLETEENEQETSMILDTKRKSETAAEGVDTIGRDPVSLVVEKEGSPLVDKKAQKPSDISYFPDKEKTRTPELGEAFQNKDDLKKENPEEPLVVAEKPGGELLKEDHEDIEKIMDTEYQGSVSEELEDDLSHWTPHTPVDVHIHQHSDHREDLRIISSFFKEEQSLQRFQKYFDVHELEAMLQEMSLKLKSAQQESLPYNVEKILDKVFRASESQILNVAENMLDTRVSKNRDLAMKGDNIFEEAAVLDDIQDLIYFVRYQHSTVDETAPLVMAPRLEEGWRRPMEEKQPPREDLPQESTEDLSMQGTAALSHLDQPTTDDTGASEVSQLPDTENNLDPGLTVEGSPVTAVDARKQLETNAEEPASVTPLEKTILSVFSFMFYLTKMFVATLPDDVQPGPDFYGLPWQPVLVTAFLGIVSFVVFFWRTVLVVKSRVYQVTEQQISDKVKNISRENRELVQKLSDYEQKIKESKKYIQETKKQNMILRDETIKYKDKIKTLEETNEILDDTAKRLRVTLESEREHTVRNQDLILENRKAIEKLNNVISMNASEFSEVQVALNEAKLSEEKVKSECHRVQEENARLKKEKEQLQQEIRDWSQSYAELSEQIKSFKKSQTDLEVALTHKDDNINALTNCITQLNRLEYESESENENKGGNESDELANGEVGGNRNEEMKTRIKQMMDVSQTQNTISVVEEDLKLLQFKLRASMSTKCNLEDEIKELEKDRSSLQSAKAGLEDECKTLRQKVEILSELYQQKEMALQKKLSQEEYERQEREQQLSTADEKAVLAAEEVKTYKRRIKEMEEELQKTERSFKDQIAAQEKKVHDNWLKVRAAERAIAEEKREAADLRHKLFEITQKVALQQEEPVIVKPMPGRPNTQNPPRRGPLSHNGSFGPSPVSGGECSPPLAAEPPGRPLSATLNRRDMPRREFDPGSGAAAVMNSNSRSSSPSKVMDEGKVNMAPKAPPPPFPGVPPMSSLVGGPIPPPIRYGPPPQLCGPFVPRPFPPPFGPGMRPPLDLREYAPGVPPGRRDLPFDPRGFVPGHTPFRPFGSLGPREYFIPGSRLPPPTHGPQDYPPPPAARDLLPSGSREEPLPASQSSSQDCSQALKQSP
ncbi:transport and Golgi organization protein 1 homolog isoform X2 [Cynocephalus volans]|uniref:transport and Golgi organization protein 1 homolog isoform X2 n=1 Tax=Cynocephalus volans TaxID=110931 RepID=UPI002FC59DA1